MTNAWWIAAGLAAAVTFSVHAFIGSRFAVRPLLESDLPLATRGLNYLCWHMITLNLAVLAAALFAAGAGVLGRDAVIVCLGLAGAGFAISVYTTLKLGIRPYRFPSTYLFPIVGSLALAGNWLASPLTARQRLPN